MNDYLGNIIEAGMTVKVIRTKPIFGDISEHKQKKNGKGFFKPKVVFKQKKECWSCVGEYLIYSDNSGKLLYDVNSPGCSLTFPISFITFNHNDNDLITIKGISDNDAKLGVRFAYSEAGLIKAIEYCAAFGVVWHDWYKFIDKITPFVRKWNSGPNVRDIKEWDAHIEYAKQSSYNGKYPLVDFFNYLYDKLNNIK